MAYFHKLFSKLSLYISDESIATLPFRQMLASPLTAIYSSYLAGPSFSGIHRINLYLTDIPAEDGRLLKQGGFLDFYLLFDFQVLARLHIGERKNHLLVAMQQAVRRIAEQEGWDVMRFERAYRACIEDDVSIEIIE